MLGPQYLMQSPMTMGSLLFIVATFAAATTTTSAQEGDPAQRIGEPLYAVRDSIVKIEASADRMRSGQVDPEFLPCGNITPEWLTQQQRKEDIRCREAADM
jgi:hypothetical protein